MNKVNAMNSLLRTSQNTNVKAYQTLRLQDLQRLLPQDYWGRYGNESQRELLKRTRPLLRQGHWAKVAIAPLRIEDDKKPRIDLAWVFILHADKGANGKVRFRGQVECDRPLGYRAFHGVDLHDEIQFEEVHVLDLAFDRK